MTREGEPTAKTVWAKVIDNARCIGCHACSTACKSENEVPLAVNRTYVKYVDVGRFPEVSRHFQVTRCNQCANSPCATACPTGAMFRRPDGIVDFDKSACIGCKACMAACPYDAIFINPDDHSAEKCNFCAHRIDIGLEPACVAVCPTQAIIVGDLDHAESPVSKILARDKVQVRRPEKGSQPRLFYRHGHYATLEPLAAQRADGNLLMWGQQGPATANHTTVRPPDKEGQTPVVLSYDIPHRAPWDWRVGAYTWTKSLAAGIYLVAVALLVAGFVEQDESLWLWATPVAAGAFLALTGMLLIWDLEHPTRFYYILTRPQWRSWLARGAFIITAFGGVLALHFLASAGGLEMPQLILAGPGVVAAVLAAVYTAFLFGQAKGRDLWQSPLLVPHMLVQAVAAGAGALAIGSPLASEDAATAIAWALGGAAVAHVGLVAAELAMPHPTEHARLAAKELIRGRYALHVWGGSGLVLLGLGITALAPFWMAFVPTGAALVALGLLAYEHAYVQAGQLVPLA